MRFAKPEPVWLTLFPPVKGDKEAPNGVRVKFAPVTRAMKRKAAREALRAAGGVFEQAEALTPEQEDALFAAGEISSVTLLRQAILGAEPPEWEGVLDHEGKPLPVTPEHVDIVLANEDFLDAAELAYVLPIRLRDAEKNGLSASPSGTGEAETPASATASSSARSRRAPERANAAKAAPIAKTPSRARKPKASGRS